MLCVIAKLPADAAGKLQALRERVLSPEQAATPLYGHITLAAYLPEDDEAFVKACTERLHGFRSFPVRYRRIEVLRETSIVVAAPSKTKELMSLHSRIVSGCEDSLDRWTAGDGWHPHTTLLYDPAADLDAVCTEMQQAFVPFGTEISRIEFSKAEGTGFTIVDAVSLL